MPGYLFKRLVLVLPMLWLIASLFFLLSRLLPQGLGAGNILKGDEQYSKGSKESRERSYRQYLHKTQQDLPLFYFSIHARAEPDTLYRVYPESERLHLRRLAWKYGNWPLVSAYYSGVKQAHTLAAQQDQLQPHFEALHTSTVAPAILAAASSIAEADQENAFQTAILLRNAKRMVEHRQDYLGLLPTLSWNGSKNQYHNWLTEVLQGNFGTSYRDHRAVPAILAEAIGNTFWLLILSMAISVVLAFELSILMVRQKGRKWRRLFLPVLFLTDSIPTFVLALLLLVLLASPAFLQLFPVYGMGYYSPAGLPWHESLARQVQFMALPVLCLTLANLPYLTNQVYRSLATTGNEDYTRTARAKGLSETRIIRKHMLRNAWLPIITLLSDFLPALVAGALIIETIFAIPGVGRLLLTAVQARDYPVMMGIVVIVALFKMLSHLVADALYSLADPRIRYTSS
ncbi:ABC transporter permease [Pontibacter ruber]|uniref:ABC transporter permease n=1 Tax=Pontibacter ruber TaxID=1343895 RepID=A0ABW5CTA2_9BACT|nr:ABC transporter permease [Pontibacter ruber]